MSEFGVLPCDQRASRCRCAKPAGHVEAGDDIHSCPPNECTGQWTGRWGEPDFKVIAWPFPVGDPYWPKE